MRYCARCLYPENHPLHLTFDGEGVCSGCRVHEEKDILDWSERSQKLKNIFDHYRNKDGLNYDCVIPVSGARDSYFIVDVVRNVYGMHPLIVSYNKHYNTKRGIRNLAYLRTLLGCDIMMQTISPESVKKITRATIKKMGSIYWHCLAGSTVYPVQTAVRFKIPLIIWGAHQGIDQVGMFSHLDEVEMTRKYRKEHDLMGFEAEDLLSEDGLTEKELRPFMYPSEKELEKVGVRGIYLNNYIRWDSKKQHEMMIQKYGYESAEQRRTFDTYNDVDCFNYSDLHDYIKFIKWGYGKVIDHASREIRLKRLTREEGISFVKKYQDVKPDPKTIKLFMDWIEMDEKEFWTHIDNFRDPRIWEKIATFSSHSRESGNPCTGWQVRDTILNHSDNEGIDAVRLEKKEECVFIITPNREPKLQDSKYILIGRGWVDRG